MDGKADGSSSEEDDDDDVIGGVENGDEEEEEEDDVDDKTNNNEYEGKEDPDPLNTDDDLTSVESDKSNSDLFDTEHVIVCQYDKVITPANSSLYSILLILYW